METENPRVCATMICKLCKLAITLYLRQHVHERTKCVRCNERRGIRCRNKQERLMLRFLLAPLQTKRTTHRILQLCGVLSKVRALQRSHFDSMYL
jgi:hypothetical protein